MAILDITAITAIINMVSSTHVHHRVLLLNQLLGVLHNGLQLGQLVSDL